MGILFKHQEQLEEAAIKASAKRHAGKLHTPGTPSEPPVVRVTSTAVPVPSSPQPAKPHDLDGTALTHHVQFSVEEFLRLVHDLPVDENAPLVMRVVEATLASVNVQVKDVFPEVDRRQNVLMDRIEAVQKRLEDLQVETVERRTELSMLEAELGETAHLRRLLSLANGRARLEGTVVPPVPPLLAPPPVEDRSTDDTMVLTAASAKGSLN